MMKPSGRDPRPTQSADADAQQLERIFREHGQLVLDTAYRLTGNAGDAEDVLQDVFLGLTSALKRYREVGTFSSWLRRVTVRAALMKLRSERRFREVDADTAPEAPDRKADQPVERIALERAIADLPDLLRVVFVLREVEGYSHAEIAELLAIREGTSQVRHYRAVRQLRAALGES
ncbi:MAG: sigma-70 family RNA polymerase sigma factor [bacterium]